MTELRGRNRNMKIQTLPVYRAKCLRGPDQQSFHTTFVDLVQTNCKPGISLKVRPKTVTSELLLRTFLVIATIINAWLPHDHLCTTMQSWSIWCFLRFAHHASVWKCVRKYRVSNDFITGMLQEILVFSGRELQRKPWVSVWNSSRECCTFLSF